MKIAVIDYGMGNLRSIANALDYLSIENEATDDPDEIRAATHLILPGVGAFGAAMTAIEQRGLRELLDQQVRKVRKPILGICLGMQLLATRSSEGGDHEGFGWIDGEVEQIDARDNLRVPHIGWNPTDFRADSRIFSDITGPADFYYVHSYSLRCGAQSVVAQCEYGYPITAAVEQANVLGTQFHPEKSRMQGLSVLKNFASIAG